MQNIIFLDTETTGKAEDARLVQLCYKFPGSKPMTQFFKPPIPIEFGAMATHHITNEMVSDCLPFNEHMPFRTVLQEALDHSILIAHNAPFDIAILEREGMRVSNYICTLKVAQYYLDEESYKLQYLRYKLGLDIDGRAHDAEGDVLVLEKLYEYLYEHIQKFADQDGGTVIDRMLRISKQPTLLRRIGFGKHAGCAFADIPKDYLQWLGKQTDLNQDLIYTIKYYLNPK